MSIYRVSFYHHRADREFIQVKMNGNSLIQTPVFERSLHISSKPHIYEPLPKMIGNCRLNLLHQNVPHFCYLLKKYQNKRRVLLLYLGWSYPNLKLQNRLICFEGDDIFTTLLTVRIEVTSQASRYSTAIFSVKFKRPIFFCYR